MPAPHVPGPPSPFRRTFSEPPRRGRLRDVDAGDRSILFRSLVSGFYGGALGGLLGSFLAFNGGSWWMVPLGLFLGWLTITGLTLFLVHSAGRAAATLHAPSAASTPRKREYSQAESLVARGLYEEAVTAFELAVIEDPTDPTPYLRVARIHRDNLGRLEDAARWFRRALRESQAPAGTALLARKELVELFTHRMGAPERALPELARMADELAGTRDGEWAARELRDIKARMSEGQER